MTRLDLGRRVGDKLEIMGGEVPLVRTPNGDWTVDLSNIPHGALSTHKNVYVPVLRTYSPTADGFAPRERLEGKYSAHAWVERHWGRCRRWARSRFHSKEWEGRLLELYNHPVKLRHLVMDGLEHPGRRLARVKRHIATEESVITMVSGPRGGGKSVCTGVLLNGARLEYGRNIAMLDTRPKSKLPPFVRRIVDLRAADKNEIIWIDEAADTFSHRKSTSKGSIGLPALLARARHLGLTVVALAPSTGIMDKVFDVLADALLLKGTTMNQGDYGRASESRIINQFPELLPTRKEEAVFVSNLIPPTSLIFPYVCGNTDPTHEHVWQCMIPRWWKKEYSTSALEGEVRRIEDSPEHQELAVELFFWDNTLDQIAEILAKRGCTMPPEAWGEFLYDACAGVHPKTGKEIRSFRVNGESAYKPEAVHDRWRGARDTAAARQRAEIEGISRPYQRRPRRRAADEPREDGAEA